MPTEPNTDADGDGDIDAGAMAVWATDFIASPIYDCSEPIKFSINRAGEPADMDQTGIVLTCDDPATLIVEIWAWDAAGNGDFCETYILVQDNMFDLCGGGPAVAGLIQTPDYDDNEGVEGVDVQLSGMSSDNMTTGADGAYGFFEGLEEGDDVTVTPFLDSDYLNGVSTFDLVLISKHILQIEPLNSPYKMIAADVNNSLSITTLDLIQLRKLILSVDTEFANNTSWRFVDAAYVFPDPTNPWAETFPEVININDLPEDGILDANIVGVKIGDVNGSVQSNLLMVDDRDFAGVFSFDVADQELKAGNEYTVEFTAADIADIQGYQFTLNYDKSALELVDIVEGVATEENFGLRFVDEGVITTSWNGEATANDVLFSLVFRANANANLSDMIAVSSRYTQAEAYNTGDETLDVAINFSSGAVAQAGFELYQNTPNPFKGETVIGFNMADAAQATITIHDVTGKALKLIRGEFAKGYNQVTVNSSELPAVGVLYYTLQSADFTATKKMIIVE